jgi:hypothetical protein
VVFQTGTLDKSIDITVEAHRLFAPVFEQANLDLFNAKYGGHYVQNDTTNTTIDILVDPSSGSISLDRLEGRGVDVLGRFGLISRGIQNRTNVLSYLWPGIDDNTFRYVLYISLLILDFHWGIKRNLQEGQLVLVPGFYSTMCMSTKQLWI